MIREFNIGKNWKKIVVVSLWVQIILLPVMAWHYYQYPLYGMFLNFLVLPFVAFLMLSGIMILLTGGFWPFAAETAAKVGHVILVYYKWICGCSMKLPGAVRITGRPGLGQIMGYIVVWGIGIAALKWLMGRKLKGQRRAVFAAVVLIISVSLVLLFFLPVRLRGLNFSVWM
mgnify:CR=1 FL=1